VDGRAAVVVVAVLSAWASRHVLLDDGAIVDRYVAQVLAGHGWAWNPGEDRNALTSFLHPALVIAVAEVVRSAALAVHLVGFAGLALAGIAVRSILREAGAPGAGLVCGVLVPVVPPLVHTGGLETGLFVAVVVALPTARARSLGLLAAAAVLLRPDGILNAAVSGLRQLVVDRSAFGRALAVFVAPVCGWLLWQRVSFGTWFPASVGVKADQGGSARGGFAYTAGWGRELRSLGHGQTGATVLIAVALAGLVLAVARRRGPLVELTIAVALQQVVFAAMPVPSYRWYYLPFLIDVVVLAGFAIDGAVDRLLGARHPRALPVTAAGAAVLAVGTLLPAVPSRNDPREREFATAAAIVGRHRPPSVAAAEIGVFGASLPTSTRVMDISGLTTVPPLYTGAGRTVLWSVRPQFVVLHWFPKLRSPPRLRDECVRYQQQSGARFDARVVSRELPLSRPAPGAPFDSEAALLSDPRWWPTYALATVVAGESGYASLLVFRLRGGGRSR
jgi:hypothetical protein